MEEVTGIYQIDLKLKKRLPIILLLILVIHEAIRSQPVNPTTAFWRLYSFSGEARLNGFYRQQERKGYQIDEKQESTLFSAGLLLRAKNYIWHPKFLMIDIDGEYTPAKADDKYLVIPDQAESRDTRKFDARLTLFPQNKFSIASYFNYGRVYNNRENLSGIKTTGNNWGSSIFYRTKKIPFSVGYTSLNLDEAEIQTGRRFQNRQNNLEGRANTSFGKTDKQELMVSHNELFRKDNDQSEVSNKINTISYNSIAFWGNGKRSNLNTFLTGTRQTGHENFSRYQAIENVNWELNKQIRLGANYMFFSDQRSLQSLYQHRVGGNLHHQLFQSLNSQISYEYNTNTHSHYNDRLRQGSLDMIYTKKVLKKHDLDVTYRHSLQTQKWRSEDGLINVINESILLKDAQITLLTRPYITASSIRVKDATGTIIYQLNLDYLLIPQNNFMQLQRIPGGQIPNNSTVYLDYTAVQPGTYEYNGTNYLLTAGMSFFNRLFGFYYRKSVQDYHRLKKTDFLTLNYFDQDILGAKLDYKYINAGIEIDNMHSTVLPYQLFRYYINIQAALKSKMLISVNGNLNKYKKLNNTSNIQFMDLSASATYRFNPKVSLMSSLNYRKQSGEGNDLNLFSFRTEFNASVQKLSFSVYYNYYDRAVYNEKINFNAINIQVSRKF
jgi:hypothetical protein